MQVPNTQLKSMLLVRVPKHTRDDFAAYARREGRTRSEILRDLIAAALGHDDGPRRPPPPAAVAA